MRTLALVLVLLCATTSFGGWGHNAMVRASGIRPKQVGTHEGVGMSTRGYTAARNNACYWGKRQALSVQYSKVGNRYYAVVRYRQ